MYPHERSLVAQLSDKPFTIIGVNSDRDREKIREIVEEKNLTWRSFWNEAGADGKISDAWRVSGWPTLYLLDSEGVIREKGMRGDKLDDAITELLAEMGHKVEIVHDYENEKGDGEP